MTFGYGLPWQESDAGKTPLRECTYGLLAPFLDGMIEAAQGGSQLIDGWESAYSYFEEKKFRESPQDDPPGRPGHGGRPREVPEGLLGLVRAVDGLPVETRRAGTSSIPNATPRRRRSSRASSEPPSSTPTSTCGLLRDAPLVVGQGGPVKLPPAYDAAIRRAASTPVKPPDTPSKQ